VQSALQSLDFLKLVVQVYIAMRMVLLTSANQTALSLTHVTTGKPALLEHKLAAQVMFAPPTLIAWMLQTLTLPYVMKIQTAGYVNLARQMVIQVVPDFVQMVNSVPQDPPTNSLNMQMACATPANAQTITLSAQPPT
jgi:hypothetical protein